MSSKARRKYLRTMFLGITCLAVLLWSAVDQFGIEPREILALFQVIIIGVLGLIALAAVVAGLWILARRLLRK